MSDPTRLSRSRPALALTFLVLACAALAACQKGPAGGGGGADSGQMQDAAGQMQSAAAPAPGRLDIVAREFTFDLPAEIPAGYTMIRLRNAGTLPHHAVLARLEDGHSWTEFRDSVPGMLKSGKIATWVVGVGGPGGVMPGDSSVVGLTLEPGHYFVACWIPVPDGQPHILKGMIRPLEVGPAAAGGGAPEPTADLEIKTVEYAFQLSGPVTAGPHVVRIENVGAQEHEVQLMQLAPGKTAEDLAAWAASDLQGPPPAMPIGGLDGLAPGRHGYLYLDLPAGDYLMTCFIFDAKDGKPHIVHGMQLPLKVS